MIVRIIGTDVKIINVGISADREDEFVAKNPNNGYMKIASLPQSSLYATCNNYKWDGFQVVVDDVANKEQYKKMLIYGITARYEKEREELVNSFAGATEQATWTKQEAEARAYLADNTSSTPLIDTLILSRGLSEVKLDFVNIVIAKADSLTALIGDSLGKQQAEIKVVEAL